MSEEGAYLITGGLGGLGLASARWLVSRGARHLLLISRHQPSGRHRPLLDELTASGASVCTLAADVTDGGALSRALAEREGSGWPPLRGVIHAAGVLADSTLEKMTWEQARRALAPKVAGGWVLHEVCGEGVEFFVMFSSAASVLGSPGQGNYAAGNSFLDGLAQWRVGRGLKALSINWGPWAEIGGAALLKAGERFAFRGIGSLTPTDGLKALERLLAGDSPQVGVMSLDLRQWCQFYPKAAKMPLVSRLLEEQGGVETNGSDARAGSMRKGLLAASPQQRKPLLVAHLREHVAQVLGAMPEQIDPHASLVNLGLDSLMTLELRNRLEASLGLELSPTLVWNYPTIDALAPHLLSQIELTAEPPAHEVAPPQPDSTRQADQTEELERLSDDELAALVASEVAALEERKMK